MQDIREYFQVIGATDPTDIERFKRYFIKKEWKIRAGQKKQLPGTLVVTIDCCVIVFSKEGNEEEKIYICHFPDKLSLELKPAQNMVNIKVKKSSFFSFAKSKNVLFDTSDDYNLFLKVFEEAKDESTSR